MSEGVDVGAGTVANLVGELSQEVKAVLEHEAAGDLPLDVAVHIEKINRILQTARQELGIGGTVPQRTPPAPPQVKSERERKLEERRRAIQRNRSELLREEEGRTQERAAQAAKEAEQSRRDAEAAAARVRQQEAEIAQLRRENAQFHQQCAGCQCSAKPTATAATAAAAAASAAMNDDDASHRGTQRVKVLLHVESPKAAAPSRKEKKDLYRAAHPFGATAAKHLTIKKGDILEIIARPSAWWKARNEAGEEGLVPSNYLEAVEQEEEPAPIEEMVEEEPKLREGRVHSLAKEDRWKRTSMHMDQISNDVINQVKGWEERKKEFQVSMENVLASSKAQLDRLCSEFMMRYKAAINKLEGEGGAEREAEVAKLSSVRSAFLRAVEVEKKRLFGKAGQMFEDDDIVTPVVVMITSMQRQVSGVDHSLVMAQAVIRGHLARRKWRPVLKQMKARSHIAREIHATEKQYLQSLKVLVKVFKGRLDGEHAKQSLISSPSCSKADIATIFAHVDSIISVNSELLSRLDERMANWSNNQLLGDIFEEITPYLKVYIQFVNNYDNVQAVLEKNMKKPAFAHSLEKAKKNPEARHLDIQSYLIMPVQRVPRYALLLRDLLKKTPRWHRDYASIKRAQNAVSKVAETINEDKREEESMRKVRSISELLGHKCEDLVQPQRRFVHQGTLIADSLFFCAPGDKELTQPYECHLFLFNDLLVIATKPHQMMATTLVKSVLGGEEAYKVREKLELDSIRVGQVPRKDENSLYAFYIQYKSRAPDHFYCHTYVELTDWLRLFADAIQMQEFKRSTLRLEEEPDPFAMPSHKNKLAAELSDEFDDDIAEASDIVGFANTPVRPTGRPTLRMTSPSGPKVSEFDRENESRLKNVPHSPIREILPYLTEALWLYKELFQVPIELQTFIPEYCAKLPPGYLVELNNRLQLLKRRLADLGTVHDRITRTIQSEKVSADLNVTVLAGKAHLFDLFVWVQQSFPANGDNQRPRDLLNALIQWYNDLCRSWQLVLDEPAS